MKKFWVFITVLILPAAVMAQDETTEDPWKYNGIASLNFSQISLTNWAQGGESSYAVNGLANYNLNYNKDNNSWANSIDMGYGIQKIGDKDKSKTDDHIELLSKYGRKTGNNWYLTGLVNFRTQFTKGYKKIETGSIMISDFLSPGYLMLAIGMEFKKDDSFFLSLSPISGKMTIVANDSLSAAGSFGVEPGKNTRSEFGGMIKIGLNKDIMENVNLSTTVDLFSNYIEKPQNIDVSWKVLLGMKINQYLSATISTHLIYDDDVAYVNDEGISEGPKVQFKEMFGVGFSYKF